MSGIDWNGICARLEFSARVARYEKPGKADTNRTKQINLSKEAYDVINPDWDLMLHGFERSLKDMLRLSETRYLSGEDSGRTRTTREGNDEYNE